MFFKNGQKQKTRSSSFKRISIKSNSEEDININDIAITTSSNQLKVSFNKFSKNKNNFELIDLKGQLEDQNYAVSKSGDIINFIFRKTVKEKWGSLHDRQKSANIEKPRLSSELDMDRSIRLPTHLFEIEKPRDFLEQVKQRVTSASKRPSLTNFQSEVF